MSGLHRGRPVFIIDLTVCAKQVQALLRVRIELALTDHNRLRHVFADAREEGSGGGRSRSLLVDLDDVRRSDWELLRPRVVHLIERAARGGTMWIDFSARQSSVLLRVQTLSLLVTQTFN